MDNILITFFNSNSIKYELFEIKSNLLSVR